MGFRITDHTADLGIDVWADDLDGLFAEAARGFVDCVTELDSVEPRRRRLLRLKAESPELLLVDWLNELLFVFETSGELFSTVDAEVSRAGAGWAIRARLRGERFVADRHPLKVPVKAVTYHEVAVRRRKDGTWNARVIFDI